MSLNQVQSANFAKTTIIRTVASFALLAQLLSGCAAPADVHMASALEQIPLTGQTDVKYHWPAPDRTNATGAEVDVVPWMTPGNASFGATMHSVPGNGGHPKLVINPHTDTLFLTEFDDVLASHDHGRNWTVVHHYVSPDFPTKGDVYYGAGPEIALDPVTQRLFLGYNGHSFNSYGPGGYLCSVRIDPVPDTCWLAGTADAPFTVGSCDYLVYSGDEGRTWAPSPTRAPYTSCFMPWRLGAEGGTRFLLAPPSSQDPLPRPGGLSAYPNNLYACMMENPTIRCIVSTDGGDAAAYDSLVIGGTGSFANCIIFSFGKPSAFTDGSLVIPLGLVYEQVNPDTSRLPVPHCPFKGKPAVAVSHDNARTWTVTTPPGGTINQTEKHPGLAIDGAGNAYLVARHTDGHQYVLRSHDQFATWEKPVRLSPPGHVMDDMATVVAGDAGRIAIAYVGTHDRQEFGETNAAKASWGTTWHTFVATSLDADQASPTFYTIQASPLEVPTRRGIVNADETTDPTYMGSVDETLGLYFHGVVGSDGRFYFATLSSCVSRNSCLGDSSGAFKSFEHQVMMVTQESGPSLFKDKPDVQPLGIQFDVPLPPGCCVNGTSPPLR